MRMRFLAAGHPRLGRRIAGVPDHLQMDPHRQRMSDIWLTAVQTAIEANVHAVVLSGEIIDHENDGFEPRGPFHAGLRQLHEAGIPVVLHPATPNRRLTERALDGLAAERVQFLGDRLDWDPPILTSAEPTDAGLIHVLDATLTESDDPPASVTRPLSAENIAGDGSVWLLTASTLPDELRINDALVIEVGGMATTGPNEKGAHGCWLIDTDGPSATFVPLSPVQFDAIAVDIGSATDLPDVERLVVEALENAVDAALADGEAIGALIATVTLVGTTRLFPTLDDIGRELRETLAVEHKGVRVAIDHVIVDAVPSIPLDALIERADPLGELARFIEALQSDDSFTPAQSALIERAENRLAAVQRGRAFGAVLDQPMGQDARQLLLQESWAALDALVRQRGID